MPDFIARVELRGNPPKYQWMKVNERMVDIGFTLNIPGTSDSGKPGIAYLPQGTYFRKTGPEVTLAEVRTQVVDAVQPVHNRFNLFIAEISSWTQKWS
jgi:hypothetical protein